MAENRDIEQNIILNYKTNAENAAKQVESLNSSFESLNTAQKEVAKETKSLDATFEEVYGDLKPLTARMGEAEDRLYELALAGQTATKEYQDLLGVVGNYRATQIQTDKVVDAAASTMGEKLGGAVSIAATATSGLVSGMALIGLESEETEKALLKVQAAMAFSDAVSRITSMGAEFNKVKMLAVSLWTGMATAKNVDTVATEVNTAENVKSTVVEGAKTGALTLSTIATVAATVATNLFSAAVAIATAPITLIILGIAALVAGIGYLAGAFGDFDGSAAASVKANKKLSAEIDNTAKSTAKANEKTEIYNSHALAMAKASGKSSEEIRKLSVALLDSEAAEKRLNAVKAYSILLEAQRVAGLENATDAQKETAKKATELYKEQLNIYKDVLKERNQLTLDNRVAEVQEATDRAKQLLEKQREAAKKALEERKKAAEDEKKQREQIQKDKEKQILELEKKLIREIEDILAVSSQQKLDLQKSREQAELDAIGLHNDEKIKAQKALNDKFLLLQKEVDTKEKEAAKIKEEEYWASEAEKADAAMVKAAEEEEKEKERKEKILEATQEFLTNIGTLMQEGSNEQLAIQEAQFQLEKIMADGKITLAEGVSAGLNIASKAAGAHTAAGKGIAIAATTIDTIQSGISAFKGMVSSIPGPVGIAAGAVAAAGVVASGYSSVKKILAVKIPGASGGGGSVGSAPTFPSGGSAPQVGFQSSSENQIATAVTDRNADAPPIQTYVVASSVTTAQSLDRNRIDSNSF